MGRKPKVKKEESKSVEFDGVKNETKEIKKEITAPVLTEEQKARKAKLIEVMKDINKKNKDCVVNFANTIEERTRISTGYETVDKLIGGGFVKGLVATIYGSKGCGKTSLAYNTIANAQKNGSIVAVVDAERSFDKERAKLFGVNLDELICIKVHMAEEALDQIIQLCKEKVVDLIVIDSISGLSPKGEMVEGKAEKQKSVADDTMALIARKLSQFFRMAVPYINDAKVSLLIIGQSRLDLGAFIKLEKLSGGHALLHNSRIILKMRRGMNSDSPTERVDTGEINEKGKPVYENRPIGFDCVIEVEKSQVEGCIEKSVIHLPFLYSKGIDENYGK